MPIDVLIEGFLFYKSAPQKKQVIIKLFDLTEEDFSNAISALKERLQNGATRLIETDDELRLVLCQEMSPIIDEMRKSELKSDIGKAGAETLAIILYRGPVSRAEIDKIRGVNSSFILRNLMVRGLIERNYHKKNAVYKFSATTALLAHLGITEKNQLPDFVNFNNIADNFSLEIETKN
ncbi:MAG: SMC-Scp complex subunit ScpB [Candidatus Paceibacterota bacterium]